MEYTRVIGHQPWSESFSLDAKLSQSHTPFGFPEPGRFGPVPMWYGPSL